MEQRSFETMLNRLIGLTPDQVESLIATACDIASQKAAVGAIDRNAREATCPHCGAIDKQRWGRTRTGSQRYRCQGCLKTFNGRTGSSIAQLQKLDQFYQVLKDMFSDGPPRSVRRLARQLDVNKDTIWRWRLLIFQSLSQPEQKLSGIVEVDETFQREPRKGSREWVNNDRKPTLYPKPPRLRWHEYTKTGIKKERGLSEWQLPIFTAMDRSGQRFAKRIPNRRVKTIVKSLMPIISRDAALCSDGLKGYQTYANIKGISHFVLGSKPGTRSIKQTFHIQNINALHAQYKEFIRPLRGSATKYLNGYVDWFMARRGVSAIDSLQTLLSMH